MKAALLFLLALTTVAQADATDLLEHATRNPPVKVACVGASITFGAGTTPGMSYPSQLQKLLGDKWLVKNFGVSGRTVTKKGDHPYWNEKAFQAAQDFQPDAVIILLGSNDTKSANWTHKDDFPADYKDLIETFKNLASKPRVFACLLPPVPAPGNYGINETNLDVENPMIAQAAAAEKADLIDMHTLLLDKPELLLDHVHPNNKGAEILAKEAFSTLTGKAATP